MQLTIDERLRRRIAALPGGWPGRLLIGTLLLTLVVQSVRLVFAVVTPVGPVGDWSPRAASEIPAEARADLFARIDPFYRTAPAAATGTSQVTTLQIQLFGIRMNQATSLGSAIIGTADGVQSSIGVGEEIQPGVRLAAVHFDHVEIDNAGRRELLYLDQSQAPGTAGAAPAEGSAPAAAATTAQAAGLSGGNVPLSPQSIRAGISFSPRSEGGRVTGIAVGQTGDGTAFAAAGFRNGDVIRSINGRRISAASDAATLLSQVQPGARLSLEVERGAGTIPIAITLPAGGQ